MVKLLNIKLNNNLVAESGNRPVQRAYIFYQFSNVTRMKENNRTLTAAYGCHSHRVRSWNYISAFKATKTILNSHHSMWYSNLGCKLFQKHYDPPGNVSYTQNTYDFKYCPWNDYHLFLADSKAYMTIWEQCLNN